MGKYLNEKYFSQFEDLTDEDDVELIYEQIEESDKDRDRKSQRRMRDYYDE